MNEQGFLEWDAMLDYERYAIVRRGSKFYKALSTTGPGADRDNAATDPNTPGQAVWEELFPRTPAP